MRAETLDRMAALEAAGEDFSRNRDVEFWDEPENRRLLRLRRYLMSLRSELERATEEPLDVSVGEADEDGYHTLVLAHARLSLRHTVRLTPDELAWLAQDPVVARVLVQQRG